MQTDLYRVANSIDKCAHDEDGEGKHPGGLEYVTDAGDQGACVPGVSLCAVVASGKEPIINSCSRIMRKRG